MSNEKTTTPHSALRTPHYRHVYVSPHFDDVPLSCGGQVAAQTQAGERVLVVTIFSRPPINAVKRTPFAAAMEAQWRADSGYPRNIYQVRQGEETRALQRLGAGSRWLNYLDAIYRGKAYNSDATLFGLPTRPDIERTLPWIKTDIASLASAYRAARFYFPLAVGNHVDHQLAHLAGRQLLEQGYAVVFYEDYPYAGRSDAVEQRIRQIPLRLQPMLTDIRATIEDKIAAIAEYGSQLGILFGGAAAMPDQVLRYATLVAQGEGLAERYWQPAPAG